jgi:hypothetical protein
MKWELGMDMVPKRVIYNFNDELKFENSVDLYEFVPTQPVEPSRLQFSNKFGAVIPKKRGELQPELPRDSGRPHLIRAQAAQVQVPQEEIH